MTRAAQSPRQGRFGATVQVKVQPLPWDELLANEMIIVVPIYCKTKRTTKQKQALTRWAA